MKWITLCRVRKSGWCLLVPMLTAWSPAGYAQTESSPAVRTAKEPQSQIAVGLKGRRDPFKLPALSVAKGAWPRRTPLPGKQGLIIAQLTVQGIVCQQTLQAGDTMIAVVTNFTRLAYFLRERDALYDGRVKKITSDAVYFEEAYPDSEGRIRRREVVKRLRPAAEGEK